ncbi:hypothetical protein Kpol_1013p63 [Vanderwaltozyma polyspora DSM 70294]|uniref:Guanine nucleotide-binding protein alpha-2 subunit n=1 Tax=Vanderwaltozyma polyspora (strain ATCC 22028 / DSM 70294 / BCRC 21397 / CBS 2163 / NBRC 10782 / NRRL Y-8283 / UCD 57-17) TaxID=436907 RepID=A7THA8_VANPO|nr:uncharacterized protein Kpol_1013p63 [Vanderwaltozyma polyspora DSM 70294]EDO18389.1 hypothetical protein Kpol_1013p63 [Vanderwaltozyma polyspora DSM 70294]
MGLCGSKDDSTTSDSNQVNEKTRNRSNLKSGKLAKSGKDSGTTTLQHQHQQNSNNNNTTSTTIDIKLGNINTNSNNNNKNSTNIANNHGDYKSSQLNSQSGGSTTPNDDTTTSTDLDEMLKNPNVNMSNNSDLSLTNVSTGNTEQIDVSNKNDPMAKVLLLGAGESGKSTILQQLKILHQNGFSDKERISYRSAIYDNLTEIGRDLIGARQKFNLQIDSNSDLTQEEIDDFLQFASEASQPQFESMTQYPLKYSKTLNRVWKLTSTQNLINSPDISKVYIMDSASYFMDNINRISKKNYNPTDQDILRSRERTSGIFDTVLNLDSDLKIHIYDVGGQRSERKKWIHCFNNVTLIIFCVSLSEYDQFLMEDRSQNRFQESLVLFDNIVNSRWFARTSVVLFLNKVDLFAEKLKRVPLENYFPDYTGGQDINKAAKYILWRFVQLNRANLNIYPHVTQATDTSNIKLVFAAIKETILQNNLKDSGVL